MARCGWTKTKCVFRLASVLMRVHVRWIREMFLLSFCAKLRPPASARMLQGSKDCTKLLHEVSAGP